jgi:ATP-dependent Clp protease protease subunit
MRVFSVDADDALKDWEQRMADLLTKPAASEVYAVFAGPIDQGAVQRIFAGIAGVTSNKIECVHLLWQSGGGNVGDSVCLYNFFRALPVDLTLYNVGSIASGAVIAYLGAKKRKTSATATFMVHRTQSPLQSATAERLHALAHSVTLDDERTEAILREHIKLSDEKWAVHRAADLWLSAKEAVECNLADEIGDFSPPVGTQVYNLGAI